MESVGFEPFYKVGPVTFSFLDSKKNQFKYRINFLLIIIVIISCNKKNMKYDLSYIYN